MDGFEPPKMSSFPATLIERLKAWWSKPKFSDHSDSTDDFDLTNKSTAPNASYSDNESKFSPAKKIWLFLGVIALLALIGGFVKYIHHEHTLLNKAATQVLNDASTMWDVKQELGLPLALRGDVEGSVANNGDDAEVAFSMVGSKAEGKVDAILQQGKLTSFILVTLDGKTFDVLKHQAQIERETALKMAENEKKQRLDKTFQDAIKAYDTKDYKQALVSFEQSVKNEYEIARSYEYIGFIYSQTGEYQQCITALRKFIDIQSDNKESYYQLAYCYLQVYDTGNALANLQQSCQLGYQPACDSATRINNQQESSSAESSMLATPAQTPTVTVAPAAPDVTQPAATPAVAPAMPATSMPATPSTNDPQTSTDPSWQPLNPPKPAVSSALPVTQ